MRWTQRVWMTLAAMSGFVSVAAGAFAAHGLADPFAKELMRTGATYQMVHALATLACGAAPVERRGAALAATLFLAGSALFSGSLYALAFGAPKIVGGLTPIGGLCFLAGWAALAWALARTD